MDEDSKDASVAPALGLDGHDCLEDAVRARIHGFIEAIIEEELETALGRRRYERSGGELQGYRNGYRARQITGTFGAQTILIPRARLTHGQSGVTGAAATRFPEE